MINEKNLYIWFAHSRIRKQEYKTRKYPKYLFTRIKQWENPTGEEIIRHFIETSFELLYINRYTGEYLDVDFPRLDGKEYSFYRNASNLNKE